MVEACVDGWNRREDAGGLNGRAGGRGGIGV
jgi:hypothetical protein